MAGSPSPTRLTRVPGVARWQDLVGEVPDAVLTSVAILEGPARRSRSSARRSGARSARSRAHRPRSATSSRQLSRPALGTVGGLVERPDGGHRAWLVYTDYTTPGVILRYDARACTTSEWRHATGAVDCPPSTRAIAYSSADGTTIRMVVITAATDVPGRSGTGSPRTAPSRGVHRPAILYGYSGFDVGLTPALLCRILAWVEAGGVYAIARLRGGSEEGEAVAPRGMREHKRNVFDDFHAAAEKLIAEGWTTAAGSPCWGGPTAGCWSAPRDPAAGPGAAAVCSAPLLDMVALRALRPRRDLERRVRHGRRRPMSSAGCSPTRPTTTSGRGSVPGGAVHRLRRRHRVDPCTRARCAPPSSAPPPLPPAASQSSCGTRPGSATPHAAQPVHRAVGRALASPLRGRAC